MDLQIPDKLYYKIGEVAKFTGIKAHVLRYWETEFKNIRPNKSRSNQRLYRRQDVDIILRLKDLLYNQGFTIAGARKKLREKPAGQTAAQVAGPAEVAAAKTVKASPKAVKETATDQMTLPLAGGVDLKAIEDIRQEILRIKKSLETEL